jgi:hypothetical protein
MAGNQLKCILYTNNISFELSQKREFSDETTNHSNPSKRPLPLRSHDFCGMWMRRNQDRAFGHANLGLRRRWRQHHLDARRQVRNSRSNPILHLPGRRLVAETSPVTFFILKNRFMLTLANKRPRLAQKWPPHENIYA